jgi:hypothetical protein
MNNRMNLSGNIIGTNNKYINIRISRFSNNFQKGIWYYFLWIHFLRHRHRHLGWGSSDGIRDVC